MHREGIIYNILFVTFSNITQSSSQLRQQTTDNRQNKQKDWTERVTLAQKNKKKRKKNGDKPLFRVPISQVHIRLTLLHYNTHPQRRWWRQQFVIFPIMFFPVMYLSFAFPKGFVNILAGTSFEEQ